MIEISLIKTFLGWSSILNIGFLIFTTLMIIVFGNLTQRIHSQLFKISESNLNEQYFQFVANYKIAVLLLNIVPYIALVLMGY